MELNKKVNEKQKEIEAFNTQIQDFQNLLLEYTGDYLGVPMEEVANVKDDKVRYDIIHQMISWATIKRVEGFMIRIVITIYDYKKQEPRYLLDSSNYKIYSDFTENI